MSAFNRSRIFDPLDLEIIDKVYEVACEKMAIIKDEEQKEELRKRIFALAGKGPVDFDDLCQKVMVRHRDLAELEAISG